MSDPINPRKRLELNNQSELYRSRHEGTERGPFQKKLAQSDLDKGIDNHNLALWNACTRGDLDSVKHALIDGKILEWKQYGSRIRHFGNLNKTTWQVNRLEEPINSNHRALDARMYDPKFIGPGETSAAHQAAKQKIIPPKEILNILQANGWNLLQKDLYGMTPAEIADEVEWKTLEAHSRDSLRHFDVNLATVKGKNLPHQAIKFNNRAIGGSDMRNVNKPKRFY